MVVCSLPRLPMVVCSLPRLPMVVCSLPRLPTVVCSLPRLQVFNCWLPGLDIVVCVFVPMLWWWCGWQPFNGDLFWLTVGPPSPVCWACWWCRFWCCIHLSWWHLAAVSKWPCSQTVMGGLRDWRTGSAGEPEEAYCWWGAGCECIWMSEDGPLEEPWGGYNASCWGLYASFIKRFHVASYRSSVRPLTSSMFQRVKKLAALSGCGDAWMAFPISTLMRSNSLWRITKSAAVSSTCSVFTSPSYLSSCISGDVAL